MKNVLVILIVFLQLSLFSQTKVNINLKGEVNRSTIGGLSQGTKVELLSLDYGEGFRNTATFKVNGKTETISVNRLDRITFKAESLLEFWQIRALESGVYDNILNNGFQYRLRKEIDEEVFDYISHLDRNNMFFNDAFLESYLYTLINRIFPISMRDGRPGSLNVRILKDIEPNAFIFPNGTMVISTGLLSILSSEEELIAVLSHEISHFVLDHSIININKETRRQQRAEFWAAFATGVAAATDIYIASKNEYYIPGDITIATAIIAYSIASEVIERLGLKYTREQEFEADRVASMLMQYIGVNPRALSTALDKIKNYSILTGNMYALSGQGTHPSIDARVNAIGQPLAFNDDRYDKIISFVNTFNAIQLFNNRHFEPAKELVMRNISSNVATEDDFTIIAMLLIYMYNSDSMNNLALNYLSKAKDLNVYPNINIPKQKAIVLIRLGQTEKAKANLLEYQKTLKVEIENLINVQDQNNWSSINRYINEEMKWTAKMLHKINEL